MAAGVLSSRRNRNFKLHFSDITSTPGVTQPGEIKLGDSFQWGGGMVLALSEPASMSLFLSQLLSNASRMRPDGQGWQEVISEANAATLTACLTRALPERISMVGIGLSLHAANLSVGVKSPYSF